jgi:putative phosphoesterase
MTTTGAQFDRIMKIGLISDTHGHLDSRIAAEVNQCDWVAHAGDIGAGAVLAALRPRRGRLVAVRGNNDTPAKWSGVALDLLESLPVEAGLELPGGVLVVNHGDRAGNPLVRHENLRRTYPDAKAIICGHSHHLCCDTGVLPWVLNPGAAGRMRTYGGPSCLILDAQYTHWRVRVRRFAELPNPRRASRRVSAKAGNSRSA